MTGASILNDVLGPVMRGPSSSHTAGSYHLAVLALSLLGERPKSAVFSFDSKGSYAACFREQGSDRAFVMALLGLPLTDPSFKKALSLARDAGIDIEFRVVALAEADHPNCVKMELVGESGRAIALMGKSIGGGSVRITALDGWPVLISGETVSVLVESRAEGGEIGKILVADGGALSNPRQSARGNLILVEVLRSTLLPTVSLSRLRALSPHTTIYQAPALMFVKRGQPPFSSGSVIAERALAQGHSLGRLGIEYEAQLLGLSEESVMVEMGRRLDIMLASVRDGLLPDTPKMQLLSPTAARVFEREASGSLALGGPHTRAAARAMAAMNINCGMGVVCAAPTAGSAGVLPGVLATLIEDLATDREGALRCLFAAGLVGMLVSERATFAAEVAGCQVEIGAAGAMAAAAVVEAAGGGADLAMHAAAISFQNTMGSVCDLVQGIVEIPCHTRNAVAASSAFVVADLVLGGYENPIPLDQTIDAVYSVGRMLPSELRVTSLGGIAVSPAALALKKNSDFG